MSIQDALRHQGGICTQMGSPFTGRVLRLLAERLQPGGTVADRLLGWEGDLSAAAQSVPLRIAGALHGMVLDGTDAGLKAVYPPAQASDDALWDAILAAFTRHTPRLMEWLNEAPQTNEVARSATLIPVGHLLARRFGLPLRLSELGASAGLNLMWDLFALGADDQVLGPQHAAVTLSPAWSGDAPALGQPKVIERSGVDLNPLDPKTETLRLLAYIWPDQAERMARARAAIEVAQAKVDVGDAAAWLAARLKTPIPGSCHMIYHTVAYQYFPPETQAAVTRMIEAAGATATADAPLAWYSMETDNSGMRGAALTLRLWPGDIRLSLGRADFHCRWVDWAAPSAT